MHGKHILLLRTKFVEVYSKKKFWIFEKLKEEGKTVLYGGETDYNTIFARDMVEQFENGKFYCGVKYMGMAHIQI